MGDFSCGLISNYFHVGCRVEFVGYNRTHISAALQKGERGIIIGINDKAFDIRFDKRYFSYTCRKEELKKI